MNGLAISHEFAVSDEFALTVMCCRWPVTEGVLSQVRNRAERGIDWSLFVATVERHRVAGLVHRILNEAGVRIPVPARSILKQKSREIAKQNLKLVSESLHLQQQFEAAGIPILMLKGVGLAQRAYGTITLKHGRDIDFLVRPADALAALALLESNGYSICRPAEGMMEEQRRAFVAFGFEIELLNAAKAVCLELHWRLSENPWLIVGVDAFAAPQDASLAGTHIRTLGDADTFVYLCVHGAKHSWFRLKWLADLNAFLGQISENELQKLYAYAQVHGSELCTAQALMLCHKLFHRALPPSLLAEFMRNRTVRRLVRLGIRSMIDPDPPLGPAKTLGQCVRGGAQQFLLGSGLRFLASQCAIAFTTHTDVLRWPLPPRLGFIYWVIRIPSLLLRRIAVSR